MSRTLSDFPDLWPAEERLRDWLQAGNRKVCVISPSLPPENPPEAHKIRATFLRYLALGGCEECRLPETGLHVKGAYIAGDDKKGEETQGLDLEGANLTGDLGLIACRICDLIVLRSARIRSLFLNGSHLEAGLHCDGMRADGSVFLRVTEIKGSVRLLGARLRGNLECDGAMLHAVGDALHCDSMHAEGGVFLRGAEIWGTVRLLGARLGGDLDLDAVSMRFCKVAMNAGGARIAGGFFLRAGTMIFGAIDLTSAEFGSINDDPACWPDEIMLDRCRYGAFTGRSPVNAATRLRWLALQKPQKYGQDFWPDSYEHCAKVLREAGHGAEARVILIEKERLQRKVRCERLAKALDTARKDRDAAEPRDGVRPHSDRVIGLWLHLKAVQVWDGILGAVVGYGRKPQNAAIWALLIVLLGWLVFARAAGFHQIKPNLPQIQRVAEWVECADGGIRRDGHATQLACYLAQPEGQSYPRFNALIYSIDTFAPVVSLEMQSYWIPDDTQPIGRFARVYLWIHIALGWGLTLLAVAGFSGLIKTDNSS